MKNDAMGKLKLLIAMTIFGTLGLFVCWSGMPSSVIALVRGVIGTLFLAGYAIFFKGGLYKKASKKSTPRMILSGMLLGADWVLLFESYKHTTVATATLCYYTAPIFVLLMSPFVLHERLHLRQGVSILVALAGMVLVSGIIESGIPGAGELRGILLGLVAALLYAVVIVMNNKPDDAPTYDRAVTQMASTIIVVLPYTLLTGAFRGLKFTGPSIGMLAVLGILHSGIAYAMYFDAMRHLKAQTIAVFSYLDPMLAVMLSAIVLQESMSALSVLGAILVLGSTIINELPARKR